MFELVVYAAIASLLLLPYVTVGAWLYFRSGPRNRDGQTFGWFAFFVAAWPLILVSEMS